MAEGDTIPLDPVLSRLGPDLLAPDLDLEAAVHSLRAVPEKEIGDSLLDQRLIAGIGNIYKSEACFAARTDPWRRIGELDDDRLRDVVQSARELMLTAVEKDARTAPSTDGPAAPAAPAARRSSPTAKATPTAPPTGARPANRAGEFAVCQPMFD